ncbi:armadillo-type protein [Lentinula detonsa]|uniref:Armadillo-type protein n=1 Tax=Lentinula detonsa TaxID=2804962 RepID=A0A9W8TW30_9AGAR|nr:armadillo-type protein [Lentinula detonsa]
MGNLVSSTSSSATSSDELSPASPTNTSDAAMKSTLSARPTHITMPPSPFSNINMSYTPSPSHRLDDPFESPMFSPLVFYTAPSTPIADSPASQAPAQLQGQAPNSPPLTPVTHIAISHVLPPSSQSPFSLHTPPNAYPPSVSYPPPGPVPSPETIVHYPAPSQMIDESFPEPTEPPDDATLDDEGLSTLERIYLYSRSKSSFHRVFIASALPELLEQVTPREAIEYVLPLLNTLAMDDDEMVKEAFSSKLVTIIWWFFTHCQLTPGDIVDEDSWNPPEFHDHEGTPTISVQAFTPILGTLLLSPNVLVGGATRYAVVALLGRIKRVNSLESKIGSESPNVRVQDVRLNEHSQNLSVIFFPEGDDEENIVIGLFGKEERALFEKEILFQVVIGMGRLDSGEPEDELDKQEQYANARPISGSDADWQTPRNSVELQVEIVVDEEDLPSQQPSQGFHIVSPQREIPETELALSRAEAKQLNLTNNPYFPPLPSSAYVAPSRITSSGSPMSTSSSGSSSSTPSSTTDTSTSGSEASLSPHSNPSPRNSQSPPSTSSSESTVTNSSPPASPVLADPEMTPLGESISPSLSDHRSDIHAFSNEGTWSASPSRSQQQDAIAFGASTRSPSNLSEAPSYDPSDFDEEGECDQAAIGRLSSMSLMAAVAASGYLDDETTTAFVSEIERVSHDPVYWVRREACFALGALAKVVPAEVVQLTLIPTLHNLVSDPVHHVRHSSLFALPTIIGRLPLIQRRQIALDIMLPMSMDEAADVRSGVLEALGEVIYTFFDEAKPKIAHDFAETEMESQTPPEELLKMFLGRTQDRRVIDGQQPLAIEEEQVRPTVRITNKAEALEAFYTDRTRPLICAFNYPAVTLTVGRTRWPYVLRDTYLWLNKSNVPGVKRTLAASLGEMAKILGEDYAQQDLLPVWRDAFRTSEDDVRLKLVECLVPFVGALPREGQFEVLRGLLDAWASDVFASWREREGIAKILNDLLVVDVREVADIVTKLLLHALADRVNTVRAAAIAILPNLWMTFKARNFLDALRSGFLSMARSEMSRRRMTYIACQQALLLPRPEGTDPLMEIDDELCRTLSSLAFDRIVGVRIGVARVIRFICDELRKNTKPIPTALLDVIPVLSQDSSHEVRSYVADCLPRSPKNSGDSGSYQEMNKSRSAAASVAASTFSRPPPVRKVFTS